MKKLLFAALLGLAPASYALDASSDPVLKAMSKELDRSFSRLKSAEASPLYFLAYRLQEDRSYYLTAAAGAVSSENEGLKRTADVEARVGSYALDNTHEMKGRFAYLNSIDLNTVSAPVQDDPDALRARFWELTDGAYKGALEGFSRVRTNRSVTAEEEDKSDDFSKEKPSAYYAPVKMPGFDAAYWRDAVKRLSALAKKHDFIYDHSVSFSVEAVNKYMVTSEGTRGLSGNSYARVFMRVASRTEDGQDLMRYHDYNEADPAKLPSYEALAADMERIIAELKATREAPVVEPYNGPAILDGNAAGVFFHEIFGHRIEGHRQKSEKEGQTFTKKVGQKIMADFLDVYDDPRLPDLGGVFLRGHYSHDDEGVPAGRAGLVEGGVLKGFLMSRAPIKGFYGSNGHGRRSPGNRAVSRQGSLIVESRNKVPYAKLREMLIEEVRKKGKPYGLVIKSISGGFTFTGRQLPQSFNVSPLYMTRVYADGRPDEVVRGFNFIGTPLTVFPKIVATSDAHGVFNGSCGAESGWVPNSAASPALLFSEIETEKVSKSNAKPPILKPPYAEGEGK